MLGVDFNQDIPYIDLCLEAPAIVKKNRANIGINRKTGGVFVGKNAQYEEFKKYYMDSLMIQKYGLKAKLGNIFPIRGPIILAYIFQVPNMKSLGDLSNLVEAPNDFLQEPKGKRTQCVGIIEDDKNIVSYLPPIRLLRPNEPAKTFIRIYYNLKGVKNIIGEANE
jgi:hypothetical protein